MCEWPRPQHITKVRSSNFCQALPYLESFQNIFFSIGCAMSKAGARDRAIEQAMRMLDIQEVSPSLRTCHAVSNVL